MERFKKKVEDKSGIFDHIIQNAMGNPVIFQSQPTNDNMKANTWGFFDDDMYVKFANNTTLKFAGTTVS